MIAAPLVGSGLRRCGDDGYGRIEALSRASSPRPEPTSGTAGLTADAAAVPLDKPRKKRKPPTWECVLCGRKQRAENLIESVFTGHRYCKAFSECDSRRGA